MRCSHCGEHCWHGGKIYAKHQYWQKRHSGAVSGHGHLGHRRRCMVGRQRRQPFRQGHPDCCGAGHPVDRHRAHLRPVPQRDRGGRSHEAHRPRQGGAFHQVRSGVAARDAGAAQGRGRHHRLPRPVCKEHHRGCGGQPAPPAHRSSGCAVHPLADPRFRHLPAGRDGGSHDEAEGAGQDPCHRCIQRHC